MNHKQGPYSTAAQQGYGASASVMSQLQQQQQQQQQQHSYHTHSRQPSGSRHPADKSISSTNAGPSSQPPPPQLDYGYGPPAQQGGPSPYGYGAPSYHLEQQHVQQQQQHQQLQSQQQSLAQQQSGSLQQPPQSTGPQVLPLPTRVPLADRDIYMLSLPSQDKRIYYDASSDSSNDDRDPSDLDDSYLTSSLSRATTNRGHKLSRSGPHIRRGRLGAYPHTDSGFEPSGTSKRRKLLSGLPPSSGGSGALALAPNLHLIPRDAKPKPSPAVLPPVPQSPLDLLLTTGLQYTLGPKNQIFKTLGMSATGLIEQEGPLIGSLGRVCAGLRGEGFEFRWEGDDKLRRKREEERVQEDEKERLERERIKAEEQEKRKIREEKLEEAERVRKEKERQEREAKEKTEAAEKQRVEDERLEREQIEDERKKVEDEARQAEEQRVKDEEEAKLKAEQVELANLQDAATAQTEEHIPNITANAANTEANAGDTNGVTSNAVATNDNHDDESKAAPSLPADITLPPLPGNEAENAVGGDAMEVDQAPLPVVDLGALPPLPDMNGSTANTEAEDAAMAAALAAEDEEGMATLRRSGRRVTNRGQANVQEYDEEEEEGESSVAPTPVIAPPPVVTNGDLTTEEDGVNPTAEEELPEYAKRIVDPELYVRSLFVSSESVEMPITRPGLAGQAAITTMEMVSPNDQEVLMHDCLTDLHRFLADSLEYRDRLAEIRDGVLGVERRRKGMWKVVRTVAEDWLREETEAQQNEG